MRNLFTLIAILATLSSPQTFAVTCKELLTAAPNVISHLQKEAEIINPEIDLDFIRRGLKTKRAKLLPTANETPATEIKASAILFDSWNEPQKSIDTFATVLDQTLADIQAFQQNPPLPEVGLIDQALQWTGITNPTEVAPLQPKFSLHYKRDGIFRFLDLMSHQMKIEYSWLEIGTGILAPSVGLWMAAGKAWDTYLAETLPYESFRENIFTLLLKQPPLPAEAKDLLLTLYIREDHKFTAFFFGFEDGKIDQPYLIALDIPRPKQPPQP